MDPYETAAAIGAAYLVSLLVLIVMRRIRREASRQVKPIEPHTTTVRMWSTTWQRYLTVCVVFNRPPMWAVRDEMDWKENQGE